VGAHEADDDQKLNRAIAAEAENQRILAEQSASVARVVRAQWTGLPPGVIVQEGPLMQPVSPSVPVPDILQQHPIAQEQGTALQEIISRRNVLDRAYFPRFNRKPGVIFYTNITTS